jgi:HSP20 family protein
METLDHAFEQVKDMFQTILGQPAPEILPESFVSFPSGADPIRHALFEVDHVKQVCEQIRRAPRPVLWAPAADCFAAPDALIVRLEVPGVSREDMNVRVSDGQIVVSGERRPPLLMPHQRPVSVERAWGVFERRFPLPARSLSQDIAATYADGILELRIPIERPAAVEPKAVPVS